MKSPRLRAQEPKSCAKQLAPRPSKRRTGVAPVSSSKTRLMRLPSTLIALGFARNSMSLKVETGATPVLRLSPGFEFLQSFLDFRARQVGFVQCRVALRQQTPVERTAEFHEALIVRLGVEHSK